MIAAHKLAQNWYWLLIRGLIGIAFGILVFVYPASAIAAFVILFGAFAFADGLFVLIAGLRFAHPDSGQWWWTIIQGLAGIAAGVLTFFWPAYVALILGILIAAWAIVTGVFEIATAIQLRKNVPGEILLIIAGLLSIALGVFFAFVPVAALLTWVWLVGIYALIAGVALIALAFRLRSLGAHATL